MNEQDKPAPTPKAPADKSESERRLREQTEALLDRIKEAEKQLSPAGIRIAKAFGFM